VLRYLRLLGTTVDGARLVEADGLLRIASDLPISNGNQVIVTDADATPDALAAAVAAARAAGDPVRVTLRSGIDDRFLPVVQRLGLVDRPWAPGMLVDLPGTADPGRGADLVMEVVADEASRADYLQAMGPAYGLDLPTVDRVANARMLGMPGVTLYLGRTPDGRPVSTGMAIIADRVAGVYFIGTVPGARGRGYGEAITARIHADATAAGCFAAVLQSSPSGRHIYERLGYRAAFTYHAWTVPD
jgi:ribosomal protein S18 acetylase RimI-like enzyme